VPLARFFEPAQHVPLARHFESAKPAFASGLVSEQPLSLSEHTRRAQESPRERWPLTLRLGFAALIPATALAIILGINVGSKSDPAAVASAAGGRHRPVAASEPSTGLRACGDRFGRDAPAKAELLFDEQGALSAVRLLPPELVGTQLGACLLDAVWKMNMSALGTKSLMLDLAY
jgi:hypothetical protein